MASGCAPTKRRSTRSSAPRSTPGRWTSEFPIHARMQAVTLEVILRVVFGVSSGPRLERLRGMLANVLQETASPRAQLVGLATQRLRRPRPLGQLRRPAARGRRAALRRDRRAPRSRRGLEERDDILSMLMLAEFEDGGAMSDEELRDQLMTLLLAGHETTATALAWTFDLLLRHPRVAAAPARLARGGRGRLPAGDDLRVAAPAPGDSAGRPPPRHRTGRPTASPCRPAPT